MSARLSTAGAAWLLLATVACAAVPENPYDAFAKVLRPYALIVARDATARERSLSLTMHLEKTTDETSSLVGAKIDAAVEAPDRLRITVPFGGTEITIARRGERVWAWPGTRVRELLATKAIQDLLPAPDRKYKLEAYDSPLSQKQLAFLPALFSVNDAGSATLDGARCRVLDVQMQKKLAQSLELENSIARLWVNPEHQLERFSFRTDRGGAVLRIDEARFSPELPPETWEPTAAQAADIYELPPVVFDQILRALMGRGSNAKEK